MQGNLQTESKTSEGNKLQINNLSVLSSIYQSKAFTKYAIYTLIGYCVTKNPKMGLITLNCNSAAAVVFNYIRFFNPQLYNAYKTKVKKQYSITELYFQGGDILLHILPLSLAVYFRKDWYNRISYRSTVGISLGSYLYQLAWAYYYAEGINVCKVYGIQSNKISNGQCKRLWFFIFLCHNITSIQKGVRMMSK